MGNEILYNTEGISTENALKQNNYEIAYKKASEALARGDAAQIVNASGAGLEHIHGAPHIVVPFLSNDVLIMHPEVSVSYRDTTTEVPLWLKILTLHYLIYSKGTGETGEQITFKQLEGGLGYFPAFQKRTIIPLIDAFESDLNNFLIAGKMIGGTRVQMGDCALRFRAFPRIDIIFVLWKGDEEFPPDGNVIFDSSIADYLTTEDIAVCSNMIAVMTIKKWKTK